ncbi:SoxR reducing system RseC family protein [bacterium]|nr:SoxR reducing system RseC family protein [bacterium]
MTDNSHEIGIVKAVSQHRTVVEMQVSEACDSCGARILCRPGRNGHHEMVVQNSVHASVGDVVKLDETGNLLLIFSFLQYGLPLLGLLGGIFIIYALKPALFSVRFELVMTAGGFIGLILGGILAHRLLGYLAGRIDCVFKISAILK